MPGAFKSGIVKYLQKYSYKNTKNEDLWNNAQQREYVFRISVFGVGRLIALFCFVLHHINPSEKNHRVVFPPED